MINFEEELRKFHPSLEVEDAAGAFQALREQGIAIRLMKNYLRICAGSEEENAAMLNALETYLKGA